MLRNKMPPPLLRYGGGVAIPAKSPLELFDHSRHSGPLPSFRRKNSQSRA